MVNVGKYTSPIECLGIVSWIVADIFVEPTGHQPNSAIPTELFASWRVSNLGDVGENQMKTKLHSDTMKGRKLLENN